MLLGIAKSLGVWPVPFALPALACTVPLFLPGLWLVLPQSVREQAGMKRKVVESLLTLVVLLFVWGLVFLALNVVLYYATNVDNTFRFSLGEVGF